MLRFKQIHQKILFVLSIFVIIIIYAYNHILTHSNELNKTALANTNGCDFEKVAYIKTTLCDLYLSGQQVIGSLCEDLCKSDKFELIRCYNQNENIEVNDAQPLIYGKNLDYKIVLVYKYNTITNGIFEVVLKSRHKHFYDFNQFTYDLDSLKSKHELDKFLLTYLNSTLIHTFNKTIQNTNDYLKLLRTLTDSSVFDAYVKNENVDQIRVFVLNVLALIQQDEYLFYKIFQKEKNILKIYGTCGHFYAIEKADSIYRTMRTYNQLKKLSVAEKFLDLVDNFDSKLMNNTFGKSKINNQQMQICDVKLENFGLNLNNDLMLIDTDMIRLDLNIFNGEVCKSHEDCNFFDCKSACNFTSGHCLRYRVNNNLQVFCEKILFNSNFIQDGLLNGVEFKNSDEFKSIIKKCLTSTNADVEYLVKELRKYLNSQI